VRAYSIPKGGNAPDDYEDAFAHGYSPKQAGPCGAEARFAVADGATETSFSGVWASLLVRSYCDGATSGRKLRSSLTGLQRSWSDAVDVRPLHWYAEEKARSGAFSTLLGLTIQAPTACHNRWHALAIGDSCLFHIRRGRLIRRFPLSHAAGFTARPFLLSSNTTDDGHLRVRRLSGAWLPGDRFYLMTDALAHWFLASREAGESPWRQIDALDSQDDFVALVHDLRATRRLRNDDVTLLCVETA
jgi:hypothetical protein